MIKKILIILAVAFGILLITDKSMYSFSKVEKIGISYEEAVQSNKPFLLLFHSDNCYYCKKFMPSFENLSKELSDYYNFVVINVNDARYTQLYSGYKVYAVPDLMILNTKSDKAEKIPSSMYANYHYLKNYLLKHRYAN
ncbi:thioredoxin family protein [bacterium]|nr:thioredoxin family protein [bacterium]